MYRRRFLKNSLALVSGGLLDRTLANGSLLRPGRLFAAPSGAPSDAG